MNRILDKINHPSGNGRKKVHLTTLGCSKNTYDSEILLGQLIANDMPLTDSPESADVIIVNTCGFINPAKEESIQAILEAVKIKQKKENVQVLVSGCLSSRYMKNLKQMIPEVDEYFGTEEFPAILNYLNLSPFSSDRLYEKRYLSTASHYAYLKISEGCNHKCAFCSIPLIRGRHRSRPFEQVIHEARILADRGVKELILIAQDTTFYGIDLYRKQRLLDLLQQLESIKGIKWIRIHYAYPTTVQDELIDFIQSSSKIVNYVDMPLQHISDDMLKLMKRGGTSRRIKQILEKLRTHIPDVALRTTFIVGHPGETDTHFKELIQFIKDIRFDRLGAFIYSPEENTPSFRLKAPSKETAENRLAELMQTQQLISREKNQALIGKKMQVLVDERDTESGYAFGRTYADSPEIDNEVIIENSGNEIGKFYPTKILRATEYEIFGQVSEEK
jgi:ribosomal protein S12 methylthiotransferase